VPERKSYYNSTYTHTVALKPNVEPFVQRRWGGVELPPTEKGGKLPVNL